MSSKVRSILGAQLHLQIYLQMYIYVVCFEGLLHLWLQSHLCLTLDGGVVNSCAMAQSPVTYLVQDIHTK